MLRALAKSSTSSGIHVRTNIFRVKAGECVSGLIFGYNDFRPRPSLPCAFIVKGGLGGNPRDCRSMERTIIGSCLAICRST